MTLVLLHWNDATRADWVDELARHVPDHEIVQALVCLGDVTSLDSDLPASCAAPTWVADRATQARSAYRAHVAGLEMLPETAARKVLTTEMELAENRRDLRSYGHESATLSREHTNKKRQDIVAGAITVLGPTLPKAGDSLEISVKRFLYCKTIGALDCPIRDLGELVRKHKGVRPRLGRTEQLAE